MTDVTNVVLVHGGFVDGSGWRGVYDAADGGRLQRQRRAEPDAVARERRGDHPNVLDLQDGPAILVGHSYGGAVITEAGTHDAGRRAGLHHRVRARSG